MMKMFDKLAYKLVTFSTQKETFTLVRSLEQFKQIINDNI